ncbi:MAG: glycosyltransferase family 2 protein [Methylacidiphilales bacterium]|nr:glycosyltransferase family 2 protein [Candidatus Methylacidiphilales bacterium]
MKFSLVLATRNRTREITRCLEGLTAQNLQDFEVIVSDQNGDDRVTRILAPFAEKWQGRLIHLRCEKGVSHARNRGLDAARGEIVGFPDDDCVYPPDLLDRVARFFDTHPQYGYLSGRSYFDDGKDAASRHAKAAGPVGRYSIYHQCIEFAMFVRREKIGAVRFDENMGLGADTPWQADEGPDLMLRLEAEGVRGYYDPEFGVWHPRQALTYDDEMIERCHRYACGSGYFLKKHRYPLTFLLYLDARTLTGVLLGVLTLRPRMAAFYWARIRGRRRGWNGHA